MSRQIVIRGFVTVKQGNKVLCRAVVNHFVDAGLKGIITTLISNRVYHPSGYWRLWFSSWNIYLGSDTATVTTTGLTALQTPIGAAPGTPPNSKSASTKDGDVDGIWNVVFVATWDAGTVSGTLGELALYMRAPDNATFAWNIHMSDYTPAVVMISRLSSADVDFSSFVIDATKPLTVEWKIQLAFA